MNPNNDPALSNVPIPILEFINVSFIEKDSIEVKFGDLFGSSTINVNFDTIDFVPSARHFMALLDVDPTDVDDGDVFVFSRIDQKLHPMDIQELIDIETIYEEVPTQLDNITFRTAFHYQSSSLRVFINGLEEKFIIKIAPNRFQVPFDITVDDTILIDYLKK